jgi:UPF0755 protein
MSKRTLIIVGIAGVVLLAGLLLFPKFLLFLESRKESINTSTIEIVIKEPIDLQKLAQLLETKGVIDDQRSFVKVGEYKELSKETIALGLYRIEPATQYRTILNGFKLNDLGNGNGESEVKVTFINCMTINDLAGKLQGQLLIDSAEFVNYATSKETCSKYGFTLEQLPALFIPNTYNMYYDTDPKLFVERMADAYRSFWTEDRRNQLSKIGLKDPVEAVTLASIVYGEQARNSQEWSRIAGLYLNRLKKGMKLQSDPTFRFCWGDQLNGVQRLLNVHRDIDCPYNTYKINGLPPGPISLPPAEVVEAVLQPEKHNFIFMMAKPDFSGLHDFSVEYADHQKFASIYQRWLSTLN